MTHPNSNVPREDELYGLMRNGDLAALERFRKAQPERSVDDYQCGLNEAVLACPVDVVIWFLENGADPNSDPGDGFPTLHAAIDREARDQRTVVALLLDHGADANQRGMNDWTPLHRAACVNHGSLEILALLIDRGADKTAKTGIDDYATAEEEARYMGKLEAANFIRDYLPATKRDRI